MKNNMNGTKRNKKNMVVALLAMVSCLSVMGISAYFTDADTVTNTFTVGKISLELQEPGWVEDNAVNILPEQEIKKDPQVLNNGTNDEYVFLEVVVPYANVQTVADDGTAKAAEDVELFGYEVNTEDWVQVGTAEKDTDAKTVTYVYAYAKNGTMTVLSKDDTTSALFEYVRLANVAEGQDLDAVPAEVVINAYGIQTTNLNDGAENMDGVNDDGKTSPADVWAVIDAKRPSVQ